jgi:putative intracellular protease/amidase
MKITILLYENMTALDAIGPYEVLSRLPGVEVLFAGLEKGLVTTDTGFLRLSADRSIDQVAATDILLIPGGKGTRQIMTRQPVIDWVRDIHPTTQFTTSVCTGSLVLGAAGLLKGLQATTYWAVLDMLEHFGAQPAAERFVEQGKIITAAGVSAGIDMALWLVGKIAGEELAKAIQLAIEYDPQPPYDTGSPAKATSSIIRLAKEVVS